MADKKNKTSLSQIKSQDLKRFGSDYQTLANKVEAILKDSKQRLVRSQKLHKIFEGVMLGGYGLGVLGAICLAAIGKSAAYLAIPSAVGLVVGATNNSLKNRYWQKMLGQKMLQNDAEMIPGLLDDFEKHKTLAAEIEDDDKNLSPIERRERELEKNYHLWRAADIEDNIYLILAKPGALSKSSLEWVKMQSNYAFLACQTNLEHIAATFEADPNIGSRLGEDDFNRLRSTLLRLCESDNIDPKKLFNQISFHAEKGKDDGNLDKDNLFKKYLIFGAEKEAEF